MIRAAKSKRFVAESANSCGLRLALLCSRREVHIGGVLFRAGDPVAKDVLLFGSIDELDCVLVEAGIRDVVPLSGGCFSVVLGAGDEVVRLGLGRLVSRPGIPELLPARVAGTCGNLRYEILPRVDMSNICERDVDLIVERLRRRGYAWCDAGADNVGRLDGELVIVDGEGIRPMTSLRASPSLYADESSGEPSLE